MRRLTPLPSTAASPTSLPAPPCDAWTCAARRRMSRVGRRDNTHTPENHSDARFARNHSAHAPAPPRWRTTSSGSSTSTPTPTSRVAPPPPRPPPRPPPDPLQSRLRTRRSRAPSSSRSPTVRWSSEPEERILAFTRRLASAPPSLRRGGLAVPRRPIRRHHAQCACATRPGGNDARGACARALGVGVGVVGLGGCCACAGRTARGHPDAAPFVQRAVGRVALAGRDLLGRGGPVGAAGAGYVDESVPLHRHQVRGPGLPGAPGLPRRRDGARTRRSWRRLRRRRGVEAPRGGGPPRPLGGL